MEPSIDPPSCHCDPLRVILQWFLQETFSETIIVPSSLSTHLTNLPLFYKSSALRYRIKDGQLGFRILQETLKGASEWVAYLGSLEQSVELRKPANFPNHVDTLMNRCSSMEGKIVGGLTVKAVLPDKCSNFHLILDIPQMAQAVVRWRLNTNRDLRSGNRACHTKPYTIVVGMSRKSTVSNDSPSMEFCVRKILTARAISTAAQKAGHQVDGDNFISLPEDTQETNSIFIVANKPVPGNGSNRDNGEEVSIITSPEIALRLLVGRLSTMSNCSNESTLNELLNERLTGIKEISNSRRLESVGMSSWVSSVHNMALATLHYDILYKPLEADVQLSPLETRRMNHDALQIMYNYTRLLSILRKFEDQVSAKEYPSLTDLHLVDFSLICHKEEEIQLLQLIMEWPRILETVVNFTRFELNLSIVPKFLFALAKAFNNFYTNVVVLVPTNAPHNFPAMMARIYLMQALCLVFEDCLDIMQIGHATL